MCIRDSLHCTVFSVIIAKWLMNQKQIHIVCFQFLQGFLNRSLCFFISCIAAVSYTHLDVYKRQPLTYSSSDRTIATVDNNGNVTGLINGDVTITAKADNAIFEMCIRDRYNNAD